MGKRYEPAEPEPETPTNNTHICPKCGGESWFCWSGTTDKLHKHRCPGCGFIWQHHPDNVKE